MADATARRDRSTPSDMRTGALTGDRGFRPVPARSADAVDPGSLSPQRIHRSPPATPIPRRRPEMPTPATSAPGC